MSIALLQLWLEISIGDVRAYEVAWLSSREMVGMTSESRGPFDIRSLSHVESMFCSDDDTN